MLTTSPALANDLSCVCRLPINFLKEICNAAVALLRDQPPMTNMYSNTATKLGVDASMVENCVRALAYVMLRAAKISAPPERLLEGIRLDASSEQIEVITEMYTVTQPGLTQVSLLGDRYALTPRASNIHGCSQM